MHFDSLCHRNSLPRETRSKQLSFGIAEDGLARNEEDGGTSQQPERSQITEEVEKSSTGV